MPTILYNNIAFIHVPKTGGCSVSTLIYNAQYFIQKYLDVLTDEDHYLLLHAPAKMIKEHEKEIKMTIAFVRNPYTRFISMFCKSKDTIKHNYPISTIGITQFCKDFKQSNLDDEIIFKPMTYYLYDNSTCIVDNILRFENFESEVQKYCDLMSIKLPSQIPHLNQNTYIDSTNYMTWYEEYPELYDFVNEVYADDFRLFNYEKISSVQ